MTREEAKTVFLNRGYVEVEGGTIYDSDKWRESCRVISEWLEQEPKTVAQERYEDLCEYFGDAKVILKNREDFKAWLDRVKWHIRKAEELYEKYEKESSAEKTGHWIFTQRDKHIDICCSECGNTRFKEYAYGYTIDEISLERIKDLIKKNPDGLL